MHALNCADITHVSRAVQKRRCLVPASGFHEWKKLDAKDKQPFTFDLTSGRMMAFAGLWDAWKDPAKGQWLQSFTILTTEANELMTSVHDRMPVILHERDFSRRPSHENADLRWSYKGIRASIRS